MTYTTNVDRKPRRCEYCPHSRAAHVDGVKCALCPCVSEQRVFVQESLTFRSALPARVMRNTRKR